MSDETTNIILPILQAIQGDISTIKSDVSTLKSDVAVLKESVVRIDARIGTMENYMAGFHSNLNWHSTAIDELRGRVEALEQKPDE